MGTLPASLPVAGCAVPGASAPPAEMLLIAQSAPFVFAFGRNDIVRPKRNRHARRSLHRHSSRASRCLHRPDHRASAGQRQARQDAPGGPVGALVPQLGQALPDRAGGCLAACPYSFEFLQYKREGTLKAHWLAHGKTTCVRCRIPLVRVKELGRSQRRVFFCERCQKRYGDSAQIAADEPSAVDEG